MRKRIRFWCALGTVLCIFLMGSQEQGCDNQQRAMQEAQNRAENRSAYVPRNDLEFNNYDRRQQLSDDPTAILWCTSAFPIPSSPLFTVPIVGKLTSGGKRPFPADPGPDGMYGTSGDYRYGFTPADQYAEWYNMPTFCTTEPTIWQRKETVIVMQNDPELLTAQNAAREALKKGDTKEANRILENAIGKLGRKGS